MKEDSGVTSYHDFRRTVVSAQITVQLAREHGVPLDACLAGSGIDAATLADAKAEIAMAQEIVLTRNVVKALSHVPELGIEAGLRYGLSAFGIWGFALLSSSTLRTALETATRYHALAFAFSPVWIESGTSGLRVVFGDRDTPEDLRPFCAERGMACAARILRELTGKPMPLRDARMAIPPPAYAGRIAEVFRVIPQFGAPDSSFAIDDAWLDTPIVYGNPIIAQQMEADCKALLDRLRKRDGFAEKVRDTILRAPTRVPDMDEIAEQLHMTPRTLRRRLADEQTSYRELVDEVRQTLAHELLQTAGMKMEEVAERLGYADATSFAHAFRRWKGHAPREERT